MLLVMVWCIENLFQIEIEKLKVTVDALQQQLKEEQEISQKIQEERKRGASEDHMTQQLEQLVSAEYNTIINTVRSTI